jgi:hypothetical protein
VTPVTPTPDRILELGQAYRASKTVLSAVELNVFTELAGGPLTLDAVRERVGISARGARDFLDALVALGMLVRHPDGRYANSPESDLYLDRNKPTYVGGVLDTSIARNYAVWGALTEGLRTGKPQCDKSAVSNFTQLYADATQREAFVGTMTARTRPVARALAEKFPWADHDTLIDIGGAQGCLPVEIARAHSHLTGGAFDLPPLEPLFDRLVREHALTSRLRFFPGDFFNGPLPSADVLVLGRVMHNLDLADKKMLLRKAYDALPPRGVLIVYERLIDDERCQHASGLISSLHMLLVSIGGFDFTGADCIEWMRETGFCSIYVESLTAEQSMVVGTK